MAATELAPRSCHRWGTVHKDDGALLPHRGQCWQHPCLHQLLCLRLGCPDISEGPRDPQNSQILEVLGTVRIEIGLDILKKASAQSLVAAKGEPELAMTRRAGCCCAG